MRKNVIALMLVLPLLFIFVVFSSGNVASLGVSVSASGIAIADKPENGTLQLDLATYRNDYTIKAEVLPANASNQNYSLRVEEVEGSELADISVSESGKIVARSAGSARVVAVSNDGGYTDSLTVIVGSSKPYDFSFSLFEFENSQEDLLSESDGSYRGEIFTGRYSYVTKVFPGGYSAADIQVKEGFAAIDAAAGAILFPFAGRTVLSVTVANGLNGAMSKTVVLDIEKTATASGITVNGAGGAVIAVAKGSESCSFYVEADGKPAVSENRNITSYEVLELSQNQYRIEVVFAQDHSGEFEISVAAGDTTETVGFSFEDFAFAIRSDLPVQNGDSASVLLKTPVTFYALPAMSAEGITYRWKLADAELEGDIDLSVNESGSACTVNAKVLGEYHLEIQAYRNGKAINIFPVDLYIAAVRPVSAVQIANQTSVGLAGRTTVAGMCYAGTGSEKKTNAYELDILSYYVNTPLEGLEDIEISLSDENTVAYTVNGNKIVLTPVGTGEVTVSVNWRGNASFGTRVGASITLNIARNAVLVRTSDQLFAETKAGNAVVLDADIMLGTNEKGEVLPIGRREQMLGSMKSTYNIEYYKNTAAEKAAYVKYVMEFKNNVYGNGHSISAENFTNALDGSGVPQLFRGPLFFVSMGQSSSVASVAGQDNIAFLIRTDGVTLYNVTLLGCNDASLQADEGGYDLSKLNNVGTTLEINADASILNCRIRNGRNVIRAYGGNRDGEHYFIDSLAQNKGCDEERIHVTVAGCVISQGREFLLKIGANRALRANKALSSELSLCIEPDLLDASGKPYGVQSNNYLDDAYFYQMYVMTDLTLQDSVLETSGFFAVGIESNFSGTALYQDMGSSGISFEGWEGTGGTSFAAVLRIKGDVRMYEWKELSLIDSSTLIETDRVELQLNVSAMLEYVCGSNPEEYGDLLQDVNGEKFVHGGIAFYGGGKNYSQLTLAEQLFELRDYSQYYVNINVLENAEGDVGYQGKVLPMAAGTQDFRFYLYGTDSVNNYQKQLADTASGIKYNGIIPISLF